ncbi:MAG: transglutaminase-like domain-containing protein [Gemmatales bacterium]
MRYLLVCIVFFHFRMAVDAQAPPPAQPTYTQEAEADVTFQFSSPQSLYLQRLLKQYPLHDVVKDAGSDLERAVRVCHWVHERWKHNGINNPKKSDAISILEEAAEGKRFRCVEYSTVLTAALSALDIPARSLGLKTADMETRLSGAGHVVTEAYLRDQKKWIMLDGQWDTVMLLEGKPLHAVELQRALAEKNPQLKIRSLSTVKEKEYLHWIAPYLYYLDTSLDQRFDVKRDPGKLMLVPVGAKNPTVFQRIVPMGKVKYTHSEQAFYTTPTMERK